MTLVVRRPPLPRSSHPDEIADAVAGMRARATCAWTCPDCGQRCRCVGDARLLPHTRCGLAAERS